LLTDPTPVLLILGDSMRANQYFNAV